MNRRPRRPIDDKLEDLERELAALTVRVAAIRTRANKQSPDPRPALTIGTRVRFHITGQGQVEGVIVGETPQRIRVRQTSTGHIYLRAPSNVTRI